MAEPVPFKPEIVPHDAELQETVVNLLRELLTDAEAGKIRQVCCASFYYPASPDDEYPLRISTSSLDDHTRTIGALYRIMQAIDRDD